MKHQQSYTRDRISQRGKCWRFYYLRCSDINALHRCIRIEKERLINAQVLNHRLEDSAQCGFHTFSTLHKHLSYILKAFHGTQGKKKSLLFYQLGSIVLSFLKIMSVNGFSQFQLNRVKIIFSLASVIILPPTIRPNIPILIQMVSSDSLVWGIYLLYLHSVRDVYTTQMQVSFLTKLRKTVLFSIMSDTPQNSNQQIESASIQSEGNVQLQ